MANPTMIPYIQRLRSLWHPDKFQGWGRENRYFEGWYFKLVSADDQHAMAIIPGISMAENGEKSAFIQVMDGKACTATFHRFPSTDFRPSDKTFEVWVGDNFFSGNKLQLALPELSGEIQFVNPNPWPKMLGAPGIMGWYSFVPFMECNHGIVSMHHGLEGRLTLGAEQQQTVNFDGGKGYIEKDWGRSFPRAYVWMQSNHFDTCDQASLMASAAHIPWLNGHFIGFISGFWLEGKLYKFATYTGARKYLKINEEMVELIFKGPTSELRILAKQAPGTALKSPLSGEMTGKIQESLQAELQIELRLKNQLVFEGTGRNAGLEVAGKLELLVD